MARKIFSDTLVRLIDEAVLPAVLIVAAKFFLILWLSLINQNEIRINPSGFLGILPTISYDSYQRYYFVNSWSNVGMFLVTVLGTAFVLIRAHYLHQSHIKPSFHAKLIKLKLARLVASTFAIYHQAVVWLIYLWLVIALLVIESYFKASSILLAGIAILVGINSSWFLITDIEHEIEIWREHHSEI